MAVLLSVVALPHASEPAAGPARGDLQIDWTPRRPFIERRGAQQLVNFDVLARNAGAQSYRLVAIRLAVFDRDGRLELARELNENGRPPAIDTVGDRLLPGGGVIDIYQPFVAFDSSIHLHRMRLTFLFMSGDHPSLPVELSPDETATIDVYPVDYRGTPHCLPLHGVLLVHDGHDLYSHHRRYNLAERYRRSPAEAVAANLYAEDFVRVTPDGQLFAGDPLRKESWLSYGEPIFAPADGEVIEAVEGVADNSFAANGEAVAPAGYETLDPVGLGNHVKIRHSDGSVSWLLHMQPGSVRVRTGEQVRSGERIGNVGFSGDSLFPHLHYNVTASSAYPSQGIPVYFRNFTRMLGSRAVYVPAGQVDTGDLVRSSRCP